MSGKPTLSPIKQCNSCSNLIASKFEEDKANNSNSVVELSERTDLFKKHSIQMDEMMEKFFTKKRKISPKFSNGNFILKILDFSDSKKGMKFTKALFEEDW